MNHNRIFRALNVLFLSCGYQVHWFNVNVRKFRVTLAGFVYFACLVIWYAICFQQHFADSSIFFFLNDLAPVLHKCIRLHLLMGVKVMGFAIFELRHVIRTLNTLVKALPKNTPSSCSWNEVVCYTWLFSGFLIMFGFTMYIMVEMEFLRPTLQQIMHVTAMFLPHFALACSVKLINVTIWVARVELQNICSEMNEIFNKDTYNENKLALQPENNNVNTIELSVITKQPNDSELLSGPLLTLTDQLELLANAVQNVNEVLQKQMILLFSMNTVCLVGATYSILYYYTSWYLILDGPIGRSFIAFNIGVFVFICWDYFCLLVANFFLEKEKAMFFNEIIQILRRKLTIKKDIRSLLKHMKYTLENNFNLRVFFSSPITWQTFFIMNTLTGLAIAVFMMYHYFKDQIEDLQTRLDED